MFCYALVGMALGYDERDIAYHLDHMGSPFSAVGLCTLNSFDPYPITYSLSNP